jgi:hypothetical protein
MDETEQLIVQRGIAAILDSPSVYMGGPSQMSLKKAKAIVDMLMREQRLVATTCDHSAWKSLDMHGSACPTCGTVFKEDRNNETAI